MDAIRDLGEYYRALGAAYDYRYGISLGRLSDEAALARICRTQLAALDVLEIACGTGRWTASLCGHASSVVATDVNDGMLAVARERNKDAANVSFVRANAFELPTFDRLFTGAFAGWWFSHIPRQGLGLFLTHLHAALCRDAVVVFTDDTPAVQDHLSAPDEFGNTYATRRTPSGRCFRILKNFYSEENLRAAVDNTATDVDYFEGDYHWALRYRVTTRRCVDS